MRNPLNGVQNFQVYQIENAKQLIAQFISYSQAT